MDGLFDREVIYSDNSVSYARLLAEGFETVIIYNKGKVEDTGLKERGHETIISSKKENNTNVLDSQDQGIPGFT